jgi:hypothetical protein
MGRRTAGWGGRTARRGEEDGAGELTCSCCRRGAHSESKVRGCFARFRSISGRRRSERSHALAGIRERLLEFGPNSGPNFHVPPNAGIRDRIPEFQIPGPILCIQTRCYIVIHQYEQILIKDTPIIGAVDK